MLVFGAGAGAGAPSSGVAELRVVGFVCVCEGGVLFWTWRGLHVERSYRGHRTLMRGDDEL